MNTANHQDRNRPLSSSVRQAATTKAALPEQIEVAELVSDSRLQPVAAGSRAANNHARQLLYRYGSLCVDVCMQPELGTQEIMLMGQLLDSQQPGHGIGDIPVSLLSESGPISCNTTNSLGEFCFGFRALHGAQLVFGMSESHRLVVPVPDTDA